MKQSSFYHTMTLPMSSSFFTYARFRSTTSGLVPDIPIGFSISDLKPEWVPDQKWDTLMASLDVLPASNQATIVSAYHHLLIVEDLIAIHEDNGSRIPIRCETWLADKYHHHSSDLWKKLIYRAWTTRVNSPPIDYFRPSLCLLTSDWLSFHGFNGYTVLPVPSMAFHESPMLRFSNEQGWVAMYSD